MVKRGFLQGHGSYDAHIMCVDKTPIYDQEENSENISTHAVCIISF